MIWNSANPQPNQPPNKKFGFYPTDEGWQQWYLVWGLGKTGRWSKIRLGVCANEFEFALLATCIIQNNMHSKLANENPDRKTNFMPQGWSHRFCPTRKRVCLQTMYNKFRLAVFRLGVLGFPWLAVPKPRYKLLLYGFYVQTSVFFTWTEVTWTMFR